MKPLTRSLSHVMLVALCVMFFSCETDSYDKGQGRYSLTQADFAEMTINDQLQAVSFSTDDGRTFTLPTAFTAKWITTADTTYRAIVYFNTDDGRQADIVSASPMVTMRPRELWRFVHQPEDPVGLESCWMARGKYINVGLLVRSGYVDDKEGVHSLALAQDTILTNADHTRTAYYRLLHDQGNAPLYYTNRHYVSLLLPDDRPDSIRLMVTTFDGPVVRYFSLH